MLHIILLALSFVLFLLAGLNVLAPKVHFGWLGLACFTLAQWVTA
jgi:hypothetical protein